MKASDIILGAAGSVFRNLGQAVKISSPLILSIVVFIAGIFGVLAVTDSPFYEQAIKFLPLLWVGGVIVVVGILVAFPWVAVGWHRFRLLDETVSGFAPTFRAKDIFGYTWRFVMLTVICFLMVLIPAMFVGLIFGINRVQVGAYDTAFLFGWPAIALTFVGNIAVATLFMRYGLILPARAAGQVISLTESWRRTSVDRISILGVAGFFSSVDLIWALLARTAAFGDLLINVWIILPYYWLLIMVSISMLTTLYEKNRPASETVEVKVFS